MSSPPKAPAAPLSVLSEPPPPPDQRCGKVRQAARRRRGGRKSDRRSACPMGVLGCGRGDARCPHGKGLTLGKYLFRFNDKIEILVTYESIAKKILARLHELHMY